MAEEAFALSPISARAALPSEEDYAAISAAFMETSRGRWFLGEYAKRNRNADTRMVLDAVARIEESLSAQRQAAADAIRDEQLAQALAALRGAIEAAQASAIAALDGVSFEQSLAPVRKGVRVIREISWRLREIGNDGRICDIIDSQASAIEAGAAEVSVDDAKVVLDNAFAALARRLSEFDPDRAAAAEPAVAEAPVAEPAAAAPSPPPVAESAAAERAPSDATIAATPPAPPQEAVATPPSEEAAMPAPTPSIEAATATMPEPNDAWLKAEAALAEAEAAELARVTEAAADAQDEAVLDLIAMEMGAPDPVDDEAIAEEMRAAEELRVAEAMAAEPEMDAPAIQPEPAPTVEVKVEPQPMAAALIDVAPAAVPAPLPPAAEAATPAAEISLGSTIIASGLLKKPSAAANDPLAPIRRMSQAERIAFFS
ncbi:hypothetical protein [Bradyrhizobium sp. Ce-3]|uniref:hypothetical protein n=1 Tax=Bradyrhizobium sp. Ce-3 TaxID=2913970 RepID=UPI001FC7CC06|nr:hypothetical protein [Bradyrhizobium sp. Ce-3]GKQ53057.1 hypothetical protein BRSPCE3_39120 [Bradyrhizobium sp. Ce-3]